jgi:Tat protein secretion system quality control protein TatD with DNase activity
MKNFIAAGGKGLINIGIDEAHNLRACQISQESLELFPDIVVKCTVGIHPCEVVDHKKSKADLNQIHTYLEEMLVNHGDHIV